MPDAPARPTRGPQGVGTGRPVRRVTGRPGRAGTGRKTPANTQEHNLTIRYPAHRRCNPARTSCNISMVTRGQSLGGCDVRSMKPSTRGHHDELTQPKSISSLAIFLLTPCVLEVPHGGRATASRVLGNTTGTLLRDALCLWLPRSERSAQRNLHLLATQRSDQRSRRPGSGFLGDSVPLPGFGRNDPIDRIAGTDRRHRGFRYRTHAPTFHPTAQQANDSSD